MTALRLCHPLESPLVELPLLPIVEVEPLPLYGVRLQRNRGVN
jgi:hypothetical protein